MAAHEGFSLTSSLLVNEEERIPSELNAQSRVFELRTIGDARQALARLRELRRDFDGCNDRSRSSETRRQPKPIPLPGKGEAMLAGLSNIQRMRTIRAEIAYLEELMVRIAQREFDLEEKRHTAYLSHIGQWTERGANRPVI